MEGWTAGPSSVLSNSHSVCQWLQAGRGVVAGARQGQGECGSSDAERGTSQLPADSLAQMSQRGRSATTEEVERGQPSTNTVAA